MTNEATHPNPVPVSMDTSGRLDFRPHPIPTRHHRQPLQTRHQVICPQVRVPIHRQADRRVPGERLGDLRRAVIQPGVMRLRRHWSVVPSVRRLPLTRYHETVSSLTHALRWR